MEEMLGNIANARQIFERWMAWHPDEQAWFAFINFEIRYKQIENVSLKEFGSLTLMHPMLTFRRGTYTKDLYSATARK